MHIREAELSDWEGILPLLRGFGRLEEDGAEGRFQRILNHPDFILVVAEESEVLVGYALAQGYGPRLRSGEESVRLHDLFTLAEYRKHGVGRALLEEVKTWVQQRGARYLEWQSSKAAIPFYEKLGHQGDPCPQPEYPFFEIDFAQPS